MAKFNFVEAVSEGYGFVWAERMILARLAFVPVVIKIICFTIVFGFGLEENLLRQGLVFLPAYFAEGWLLAYAIRYAMYNETWEWERVEREVELDVLSSHTMERYRAITGAMVLYVMIKIVNVLIISAAMDGRVLAEDSAVTGQGVAAPVVMDQGAMLLLSLFALGFMFWAFRFLWFYVPVAMGLPLRVFWERSKALNTSYYMIGLWLMAFVPVVLVLILTAGLLSALPMSGTDGGGEASGLYVGLMMISQVVGEVIILLISSVAMAYGVSEIMSNKAE